jgi:hypothetical protein
VDLLAGGRAVTDALAAVVDRGGHAREAAERPEVPFTVGLELLHLDLRR